MTVEVACDESGSEGEKLVGGTTDVFAHASVTVTAADAAEVIDLVRVGARSPANEVKASVILRQQNRWLLEWFLEPGGPLDGRARVHLTDKGFHLTTKVLAVLDPSASMAEVRELHQRGPDVFGVDRWARLLERCNDLLRAERYRDGGSDVVLDPLVPALASAVTHWANQVGPIHVVHDVQAALTPERVAAVKRLCASDALDALDAITFVDSSLDPRIQVADFLAGAARRIASESLAGKGDSRLAHLLRPYVDPDSIWFDEASWSVLGPTG